MKKMVYVFKEIAIIGNIIGYHFSEIKDPSYPGYELELIGTTEIDITPVKKTVTRTVEGHRGTLTGDIYPDKLIPPDATNIKVTYEVEE